MNIHIYIELFVVEYCAGHSDTRRKRDHSRSSVIIEKSAHVSSSQRLQLTVQRFTILLRLQSLSDGRFEWFRKCLRRREHTNVHTIRIFAIVNFKCFIQSRRHSFRY